MLRVPETRNGEEQFEAESGYAMHPGIQPSDHFLRTKNSGGALAGDGALLAGGLSEAAPAERAGNRELEAIHRRNAVFDDAAVRDALTDLHERGDELERELFELPHREAGAIGKRAETFLEQQHADLSSKLTTERQKKLFELAFAVFSADVLVWSKAMREAKTRAYQAEVTERQNKVFLRQALRPENLFDDAAQTMYRDMCLLNLDNLYAEAPEAERRVCLDEASREFCRQVLDKRLETDPARMRTMLDAPAVRRVFGDDALARYEERAAAAIRGDDLRAAAESWFSGGLEPDEARRAAAARFSDEKERKTAIEHYRDRREAAGRGEAENNLLEIDTAWGEIVAEGLAGGARLAALRHTDPDLAEHFERQYFELRRRGGAPARPDYAHLLKLADAFDPRRAAETLRDRKKLLEIREKLGGADSPAFSLYARLFLGRSTPADTSLLDGLRQARSLAETIRGDAIPEAEMADYLRSYCDSARIFAERHGYKELDHSERAELARRAVEECGWSGQ